MALNSQEVLLSEKLNDKILRILTNTVTCGGKYAHYTVNMQRKALRVEATTIYLSLLEAQQRQKNVKITIVQGLIQNRGTTESLKPLCLKNAVSLELDNVDPMQTRALGSLTKYFSSSSHIMSHFRKGGKI